MIPMWNFLRPLLSWWVIIACAWLCLTLLDYFLCVWLLCLEDFPYPLLLLITPYWCLIPSGWSQQVSKSLDKVSNHPYSKLGPIFTHVNRFNFQGLVLSSYLISMIMHLPRIHLCHLIFHSLHYHLVIRDHLLIVLTEFLTLIKSMTIWPLSYAIFLSPLEFEINCLEATLWPIFTLFNLVW
jgi:hypothetical protein